MSSVDESRKRSPILVEPNLKYSGTDGSARIPTCREIFAELLCALNFIKHPTNTLLALNFCCYLLTATIFVIFVLSHLSFNILIFTITSVLFLGTIYNSVWFHRFCCHSAYKFKKGTFSHLFLWTNPLSFIFREEIYAIPHRIHHEQTERPGDPYGPHLGWLGSFLAAELTQRLNTNITERDYELLTSSINHIGLRVNGYQQFLGTGSIENVTHYLFRAVFATLLWTSAVFALGGMTYVLAWCSSLFIIASLIRDFNWRGHGGNSRHTKKPGWEFDDRSYALNQRFYGYIASEWHDNHHKYPTSANNGFLPGQIDIAFHVIKTLRRIGIVQSYIDSLPRFKEEQLHIA